MWKIRRSSCYFLHLICAAGKLCTLMLIRLGYDIQFETIGQVPIVTLLNVHPSRKKDLRELDELHTDPLVKVEEFEDTFGNHSCRLLAPHGKFASRIPR